MPITIANTHERNAAGGELFCGGTFRRGRGAGPSSPPWRFPPPPEISENSLSSTPDRPRLIPMARVKETCFPFLLPARRTLFTSSPLAQKFL